MTAESVKPQQINGQKIRTAKQEQIITLHTQQPDASMREIARQAGCDGSYVTEVLQRYGLIQKEVNDFKTNRANIFAGLQHQLLSSITQADIQKTPIASRIVAAGILYDKERLESDKSTSNHDIIFKDIAMLKGLSGTQPARVIEGDSD
jgi:predicted DNA-binding protein YlxM (UPF0122 family)